MAVSIRHTRSEDFPGIERLSRIIYPSDLPWTAAYISKHIEIFPEGQFVAVESTSGEVVGMAASLIITWDDYEHLDTYNDFTSEGWFTNHDPSGRTLYGAEVMVDPERRGQGIGSKLYDARKAIANQLGLLRIRAGARLAGYSNHAADMSAENYVRRVIAGDLFDSTLSFQLRRGFRVLSVVADYFARDPRSRGYAAIIEWLNEAMADEVDYRRVPTFR